MIDGVIKQMRNEFESEKQETLKPKELFSETAVQGKIPITNENIGTGVTYQAKGVEIKGKPKPVSSVQSFTVSRRHTMQTLGEE